MVKVLNLKKIFLVMLSFLIGSVFLCSGAYAKITLENPIGDPNTIIIRFDERSDFEKFRDGLENVNVALSKQRDEFGSTRQVKFYNQWLFDLTLIFEKNLSPSLQDNDYMSNVKLYDIFSRILLSDFKLMGVVKDCISADCTTIFGRFNTDIYERFKQVPSGGVGIIFHTDVPVPE